MHLLRLRRRRVLAGADGPHRLVGEHHVRRLLDRQPARLASQLPSHDLERLPAVALGERLADADDGPRPGGSTARAFLRTVSSVSPKSWRRSQWPTMTQRAAGVLEHRRREISPVNAP